MRIGRSAFLASILLLPLLAVGCKKKVPPDEGHHPVVTPPTQELQVAGVDPAFSPADRAFEAEVFGSAFESGARVQISGAAVDGVRFVDENALRIQVPAMPVGSYDVTVVNPDGAKATLRKGLTLTAPTEATGCQSATIHFDFDSTVLGAQARQSLDSLAACLRNGTADVRIEGHCDERGTTEYNLALGERRANAVQRYLVGLGVSPAHLRTVSYGEERPVDRSGTAAADAANRRAEILVRE